MSVRKMVCLYSSKQCGQFFASHAVLLCCKSVANLLILSGDSCSIADAYLRSLELVASAGAGLTATLMSVPGVRLFFLRVAFGALLVSIARCDVTEALVGNVEVEGAAAEMLAGGMDDKLERSLRLSSAPTS